MERHYYLVQGRVQGVGYRAFVAEQAGELELSGWVRNRPDGAVELEVQGPASALTQLASALRQGPLLSRVDTVSTAPRPMLADELRFRIQY